MQGLPRCMFQWHIIQRNKVKDLQSPGKTRQHVDCSSALPSEKNAAASLERFTSSVEHVFDAAESASGTPVPPWWLVGWGRACRRGSPCSAGWPSPATCPVHLSGVQAWLRWAGAGPAAAAPASSRAQPPGWSADARQASRAPPGADTERGAGHRQEREGAGRRTWPRGRSSGTSASSCRSPARRPLGPPPRGWRPHPFGSPKQDPGKWPPGRPRPSPHPACLRPPDPPSALQPGPPSLEPQRAARGHFS